MSTKQQRGSWFDVDRKGLARTLEGRDKSRIVAELVQNSWDEDGVTNVSVDLEEHATRGKTLITVSDDAPDGFKDLSHAYTMFAASSKVTDATKRGRFNLGEKLFLALCEEATIVSTTGGWSFSEAGREQIKTGTDKGSIVSATLRMTKPERLAALDWLNMLLAPEGIETRINGRLLPTRTPVHSFTVTLPTQIADEEGVLRPTRRKTTIRLFEPTENEKPHIYEMGIPVVEHDGRWHIDVGQKVPLNMDRDNVTPAYLRELRVHVLNEAHHLLDKEIAREAWVSDALSDKRVESDAVHTVVRERYGDKVVSRDLSDPQANAEAVLKGYEVVAGGSFSKDAWKNIREAAAILPAGQVTPSPKVLHDTGGDEDKDGTVVPESEWTAGMHQAVDYAKRLAKDVLGVDIQVRVQRSMQNFLAWYGPSNGLSYNLQWLGHRFFNECDQAEVDALLIHEFAHHRVSDHLSENFHTECCRLGALLRNSSVRI